MDAPIPASESIAPETIAPDPAASSLLDLLDAGGPVMYVLAALSVCALTVILMKLFQLAALRMWSRRPVERALALWHAGKASDGLGSLEDARHPVARVLQVAIRGHGHDEARHREEVERIAGLHLDTLSSGLRVLGVIATLSPLLGLLGTVIGMIDAFQALEAAGNQVDPSILSGGIWVALLTTAAGLVVAIPAAAAHQWLDGIVERTGRLMEDATTQVFTHRPAEPLHRQATAHGAAE